MSAPNIFKMINRVSLVIRQLEEMGMRIEIGDDFKQYNLERSGIQERASMGPIFDVSQSFIDKSNGIYICGYDQSDNLVHSQAVRLLDLQKETLADHLSDHCQKYVVPGTTPDPDQTYFHGPDAISEMTGRIAYQGDFWLKSVGLGGPRSHKATGLLSRLVLEIVQMNWSPDHIIAFVPKRLAEKGVHLRYGFSHCELGSWIGPDEQITDEEYFIWMNQRELTQKLAKEPAIVSRQDIAASEGVVTLKAGA